MRQAHLSVLWVVVALLVGGCSDEEEAKGPQMDFVVVQNETAVDLGIRVNIRLDKDVLLPYAETIKIEFLATKSKIVQVKAKSKDPNWNDCLTSMKVGQTLVVYQDQEMIACRAE